MDPSRRRNIILNIVTFTVLVDCHNPNVSNKMQIESPYDIKFVWWVSGRVGGWVGQGGRKFEISWEPNFPVNNFARNKGKNCAIIQTIINVKFKPIQDWSEIQSQGTNLLMAPVLFRHWTIKIKPKTFLRPLRDFSCEKRIFLVTGNFFL